MERVHKKEDQRKVTDQVMSPVQMARVMGNQATIVQMCTDWNSEEAWAVYNKFKSYCTENFIRRHICGIQWPGERTPTKISKKRVYEVVNAYDTGKIKTDPDGWCVYKNSEYAFTYRGLLRHYVPNVTR